MPSFCEVCREPFKPGQKVVTVKSGTVHGTPPRIYLYYSSAKITSAAHEACVGC